MARIEVNGLGLDYELIEPADTQPLVVTPGDATRGITPIAAF
jgi:hypothetical protein